jgi:hypothetical protein
MTIAFVLVILIVQKKKSAYRPRKTFALQIFSATWLACGIPVMLITILFFATGSVTINTFYTVISASLGIGYYLTGCINDIKFMKVLAFGWWGGAVLAVLWNYIGQNYQLSMLFVALIILFELIPGIIIYNKWKKVYNA